MKFIYLLLFSFISIRSQAQKANVIIIYADDLGYGDVSAYGQGKIDFDKRKVDA
jgi:hypothetical protein